MIMQSPNQLQNFCTTEAIRLLKVKEPEKPEAEYDSRIMWKGW